MRKCHLVFAVLTLMAMPAFASDGVVPPTNPKPPLHDRLVDTPMTCMMPTMPYPYIGGGSPAGVAKMGVMELTDFAQNASISLSCFVNAIKITVINFYVRFMAFIRAILNGAQSQGQPSGN